MLEGILGNKSAAMALLHLYHYGEIHASAVASDYGVSITPIKKQFERFEEAGVIISREVGKTRPYQFNLKNPLTKPLMNLIKVVYDNLKVSEKEKIFNSRRKPRRQGKPVIDGTLND
jgi:hypothetical protein